MARTCMPAQYVPRRTHGTAHGPTLQPTSKPELMLCACTVKHCRHSSFSTTMNHIHSPRLIMQSVPVTHAIPVHHHEAVSVPSLLYTGIPRSVRPTPGRCCHAQRRHSTPASGGTEPSGICVNALHGLRVRFSLYCSREPVQCVTGQDVL